jgi:anti-anti-sigma factor
MTDHPADEANDTAPLEVRTRERFGDVALIELRGELTGEGRTRNIQRFLEDHYVDDGVTRIRLDLGLVRRMDLEGIATLIALWRESRERGKALTVEGAQGQVREKLRDTGLLDLLEGRGGAR